MSLSLVGEAVALVSLGLVRPWGERVPRWILVLGGRRVAPHATFAATTGAMLVAVTSSYHRHHRGAGR